jgi:hypothetical protein
VPEHVGVIKRCATLYVVCAFVWFGKRKNVD